MPGDTSSTDVVSSGFGWPFGGFVPSNPQSGFTPTGAALLTTMNLKDQITSVSAVESLRHEIRGVDAKVSGLAASQAASEARTLQRELDAAKSQNLIDAIVKAIGSATKTNP